MNNWILTRGDLTPDLLAHRVKEAEAVLQEAAGLVGLHLTGEQRLWRTN